MKRLGGRWTTSGGLMRKDGDSTGCFDVAARAMDWKGKGRAQRLLVSSQCVRGATAWSMGHGACVRAQRGYTYGYGQDQYVDSSSTAWKGQAPRGLRQGTSGFAVERDLQVRWACGWASSHLA